MATILDLFKANKKEIYGKLGEIYIDSRGFINPPRAAALAASSPNVAADLIGGQLAGAIGGTANRPSDTIFKKGNPGSKPITITAATQALLRDAVDGDYNNNGGYVIKTSKSPDSVLADLSQGGSSATGVATNLAISALNTYGSKGGFNKLKEDLKTKKTGADRNGSKFEPNTAASPRYTNEKPFSKFKEDGTDARNLKQFNKYINRWDNANDFAILNKESYESSKAFQDEIIKYPNSNQVPVLFKKYGNSTVIPFVGTVSAISEDVQPEWTNFKYIGSPFKTYRYSGVERSLKFNLKLYYHTLQQKSIMIKKINYLKSLAFPFDTTSTIYYGEKSDKNAQIGFSPNLLFVSIGDMYKEVFGYMESLSFSIDENTTWHNFNQHPVDEASTDGKESLYPSVVDVSIGIKLIENSHEIKKGTSTYNYNFDGRTTEEDIKETAEENANKKIQSKEKINTKVEDLTLTKEDEESMTSEQIAAYYGHGPK
jgi:hypothetical protein